MMQSIPCINCLTYPICKVDEVNSAHQCNELIHSLHNKCCFVKDYLENKNIAELEKIQRVLDILLYLTNKIDTKSNHIIFDLEGRPFAYYCFTKKILVKVIRMPSTCEECGQPFL